MSPEAQRIAIAEACGWTDTHCVGGLPCGIAPCEREHRVVPDYLNDLNAMAEAEKVLTIQQRSVFMGQLLRLAGFDRYMDFLTEKGEFTADFVAMCAALCFATAAQRAEAFLRAIAIGKWGGGAT